MAVFQKRHEDRIDARALGEGLLGEFCACAGLFQFEAEAEGDSANAAGGWHGASRRDPPAQLHKL